MIEEPADACVQTRGGLFPIGGRSTAIRLPSSEVFVYVSSPHTPATAGTIAKMGEVQWLVTPDGEHSLYIEDFVKAYPNAKYVVHLRERDGSRADKCGQTDRDGSA